MHKQVSRKAFESPFTILALIVIGVLFFSLNNATPTWGDDWWRSEPPSNFLHIFSRLVDEYSNWTGRLSVLFTTYLFLLHYSGHMLVFAIANTVVMLLALHKMASVSCDRQEDRHKALVIICGFALLWLISSAFGEATLWKTGAIAYLWPATAALYLADHFINGREATKAQTIGWSLLAFWVGNSLENLSVSLVLFCCLCLISTPNGRQKNNLIILAAMIAGMVLLIAAPGNFNRYDMQHDGTSILNRAFPLLKQIWKVESTETFSVWLLLAITLLLNITGVKVTEFKRIAWLILGLLCATTMLGSTGINYGTRTAFVAQFFFVLTIVSLLAIGLEKWRHPIRWLIPIGIVCLFLLSASVVFQQIFSVYGQYKDRLKTMSYYKAEGFEEIVLPSYKIPFVTQLTDDLVDGPFFLRDLHMNTPGNTWRNSTFANYHGFKFAIRLDRPYLQYIPRLKTEFNTIKDENNVWIGQSGEWLAAIAPGGACPIIEHEHERLEPRFDTHLVSKQNMVITLDHCFYMQKISDIKP